MNVPGDQDSTVGDQLVEYLGPNPERGSHRFAFLVYEQTGPFTPEEIEAAQPARREKFKSVLFQREHNLRPVGGAFYYANRPVKIPTAMPVGLDYQAEVTHQGMFTKHGPK